MTFKDIRIWSRSMTYNELASCNVRCLKNRQYKQACAYNSMAWLNAFNTAEPYAKITNWKHAIRAYNLHKNHK